MKVSPRFTAMKFTVLILLLASLLTVPHLVGADQEYWIHEKDLMSKMVQLRKAKKALKSSIAAKSRARTKEDTKKVLEEIQNNYRYLQILKDEYQKEVAHMRFKHPEGYQRGKEQVEVKYRALRVDELDDQVKASGVDLVLNEIRDQVEKAYEPLPEEEDPYKKNKGNLLITPTTLPQRPKYSF